MIKIIKIENSIYENIEPFFVNENNEKVWNIPYDLNELKLFLVDTVKWQSGHSLKKTDWAVTKCVELGLVMSDKYPDISAERIEIREWSNEKEFEIEACTTFDELIALDIKI